MLRILMAMGLAAILAACTRVVWVKEQETGKPAEKIHGIPFFVKTANYKQVTVYSDTWLRATLIIEKKPVEDKAQRTGEKRKPDIREITKEVSKLDPELAKIKVELATADLIQRVRATELIKIFSCLKDISRTAPVNPQLVKNMVVTEWVVDPSRTFYLNAPLPWFGAGNLTQEINDNGTLAKATSTPDTKLAEGLSTLIPIKEVLTGKFVEAVPVPSDDADSKTQAVVTEIFEFKLSLRIEEMGYEYTLERQLDHGCLKCLERIPFDSLEPIGVGFSRKPVSGANENAKEEAKESGKSLVISGEVTFPENWDEEESASP